MIFDFTRLIWMGAKSKREFFLTIADVIWSSVFVAPFIVLYWRGVWDLLDDLVNLYIPFPKVIIQGKLIAVAYTLRVHIETSSLWAEFVKK